MTTKRGFLGLLTGAAVALTMSLALTVPAVAQDVTLRMHQFLPAQANVPKLILDVWADKVEAASGNRIKIQRFPSMQLGGKPPELMDQAIDGVADIVWTVVGYTPGRFPRTEVFELPFMMTDAASASRAYWKMFDKHMKDTEFANLKILGTWVHGPGVIHANRAVNTMEDLNGLKVRGPSRMVNSMLKRLGATPVGMPVPAVPEALSKGVIDATVIPWEVTAALKVPELVKNHTEFNGPALYTVTFVLAMNKPKWDSLPDDLKKIINDNSGEEFSVFAGRTMQEKDAPARELALKANNNIVTITEKQAAEWKKAAQPIYDEWIADMKSKGIDGQALIEEAKSLMK